jgi:hypothetical protein
MGKLDKEKDRRIGENRMTVLYIIGIVSFVGALVYSMYSILTIYKGQ